MQLPLMIEALRGRARERRLADDWLSSATGAFVPPKYEWRARSSPRRLTGGSWRTRSG